MIKGIYASVSGMIPRILKQEICASNMANINTRGFKIYDVFIRALDNVSGAKKDLPRITPMISDIYIEFEQGDMERTDNGLDPAIDGDEMSELAGNLKR